MERKTVGSIQSGCGCRMSTDNGNATLLVTPLNLIPDNEGLLPWLSVSFKYLNLYLESAICG